MDVWFYTKCFFIGISASSTVGPIFILTFNRGALHGFAKGFATALGSALADGLFFMLGFSAILQKIEQSPKALLVVNCVGGILLIILGVRSLKSHTKNLNTTRPRNLNLFLTTGKSFILTMTNPFVLLFFMFISMQILPEGASPLSWNKILLGSIMVTSGSLAVLGLVALTASYLGSAINKKRLEMVSYFAGLLFIGTGIYFLGNFTVSLLQLFYQ